MNVRLLNYKLLCPCNCFFLGFKAALVLLFYIITIVNDILFIGGRIMIQGSLYYTANEVMEMLGISRGHAYKIVKQLNDELASKGFIVVIRKYL